MNIVHLHVQFPALTMEDMEIVDEGRAAALQGDERDPYPPGNRKHDLWEVGYKEGVRPFVALWHGLQDPYGDGPAGDEHTGELSIWYERGQRLAMAVGPDKLDEILGRAARSKD